MQAVYRTSVLFFATSATLLAGCGERATEAEGRAPAVGTVMQALGDPPLNHLPVPQTTNEDSQLSFEALAGNQIFVEDIDSGVLTVQINVTNGTFEITKKAPNVTVTGNKTFEVILSGPRTDINASFEKALFYPAQDFNGLATLHMNSSDNDGNTDLDTLDINVTAFNDPPLNNVPTGTQAATEDVPRSFNIPVIDVDLANQPIRVTLTSSNSTDITLPPGTVSALSFTTGDGTRDTTMVFTGTLPDVNAALNGVIVTPQLDYIGTSTLTIMSEDNGATGAGKVGEDTDTLTIFWSPVNDAPVNTVPVAQNTIEETPLTLSVANANALGLTDVDAPTALVQVTLDAQGGTLTLGRTTGLSFSSGDGAADATMTFNGTLANLNAALDGVVFNPNLNFAGTAVLTMTSNDLGNSGAGGARQDVDAVNIHVSGVNDAPRNSVPLAQQTNEDVARAFSVANGNAITVADVDAPSLQVTVTATNGVLTLGVKTGLSFQAGDGTGDATMTFTGTVSALNGAVNGLTFTPTPNFLGAASVTVLTSDLGATGTGGTLTDEDAIAINVVSVNDAPDAVNDSLTIAEDAGATVISVLSNDTTAPDTGETLSITLAGPAANGTVAITGSTITYTANAHYYGTDSFSYTVSDGNGGTDTATVTVNVTSVNDNPTAAADSVTVLQNSGPTTISVLSNDSAAPDLGETLTISSVSPSTNGGNVVITSGATKLTYAPAAGFAGTDTFTYTIGDGNGGTATATVTVTVDAVNTKPVNTLPAPQQTLEDTQLTFSSAAGNALSVTDANNATLTVQVSVTNGTFTLGVTTNLTVTGNGTATVTAQGTLEALNNGLNNSRYVPTANYNGPATLTLNSNDSTGESDLDTLTLTVTSLNDAPVNTVPTSVQASTEDVPKTFNSLLVSDVDVGASPLMVTLTADNGTSISLPTTAGLAFNMGDGVADATMTFTGTLTAINTALNGLTVTPPANAIGNSTLTITTNDQGSTGGGGPAQDTDVIQLSWSSVNDPPVNSVPFSQATVEETSLAFSAANGNLFSISDSDVSAALLQVTLNAQGGTLTLGSNTGLTFGGGDGTGDVTMTFTGTLANLNNALIGMVFAPTPNFAGTATVTITTSDLGNSGSGGAKQDVDSVAIEVTPVNDGPLNTVPAAQQTNEDVARTFSSSSGNAITVADVDAASLQVSLSATSGTLTLAGKTGLTFQSGDGTADATMTFTGTVAALNTAMNGLSFAPTPNFNGAASVTILTSDLGATGTGGTLTRQHTIAITVNSVNDLPEAVNDSLALDEDAAATLVTVLANDTIAPDSGESLSITAVGAASNGVVTNDGTSVTYQPNANYYGTDSFSYTVSDGNGGTATATVTVSVNSVNDAPTAANDSFTVLQNSAPTTVNVLSNDSAAPDLGETLTVTSFTPPANGTVTITGGGTALTYAPNSGFTGTDPFTYTLSDGNGGTATATVTASVAAVNTTPVNTLPPPQQTIEDNPLIFSSTAGNALTVTDANNATLTVQISVTNGTFSLGATTNLTVTANNSASVTASGTIAALNTGLNNAKFNPTKDYNGPATLTMNTSDNTGESDVDVLTLTVTAINDAPLNSAPTSVQNATEDVPKTFNTILVTDPDVGASQLLVTLTADNGTLITLPTTGGLGFLSGDGQADTTMSFTGTMTNINTALNGIAVTPPLNYIGPSNLIIVTNDQGNSGTGSAGEDTDTVRINWVSDNDPPINTVPGAQAMLEEGVFTFSSPDGTALTVADADLSAGLMRVTLSVPSTQGRISLGNPGLVTVTTGTGTSDATVIFNGTLANVNSALEGTTFAPNVNFTGNATLTMTSFDQGNAGAKTDADTIAVAVAGVNDAPVNTVPINQSVGEDGTLVFSTAGLNAITVTDVDATNLQVTLSVTEGTVALQTKTNLTFQQGNGNAAPTMTFSGPVASINSALNNMRFVPTPNYSGTAYVTILTNDRGVSGLGGALSAEDVIPVGVVPVNDAPTAVDDTLVVDEDSAPVQVAVLGNDTTAPETGETMTITSVSAPANGTASTDGFRVTYQPNPNYSGADTFTYTINDGQGAVDTASVNVTVNAINDPPDAVADTFTTEENSLARDVPVLLNDTSAPENGETLTITAVTTPEHGTVTITNAGKGISYRPAANYFGPDLFTYTLSDGKGGIDTADVAVTVEPFDYKPVAAADTLIVAEDSSGAVTVLANDTHLGNAPITITISTPPANGTVVVQGDNTVLYTPTPNYRGADSFGYTVTDNDGDAATATVTVTVTGVNDVPVANDDTATTDEDTSIKVAVQANDTGLVDVPVTIVVTTASAHGTTTVEVDGQITYQPAPDYAGTDTFQYTATDSDSQTSTATVTVTINPVEDAPQATADSVSTRTGEALVVDVLANDLEVDGQTLTITAVTAPANGTATQTTDARVRYVPNAGFTGTDQFQYTITDGALTATATVTVGVGLDTDGDGLIDVDELQLGTDPDAADTDDDLLSDSVEVNTTNTDPVDGDTDDDGLLDGTEDANKNGTLDANETSPTNPDTDGDELQDGTERGLATAESADTNAATFVPDRDPSTRTDPRKTDSDSGGLTDGEEDANHNGRVDAGEKNPLSATDDVPSAPDRDGDGVPDATDNCPGAANATQADADGDGVGDACQSDSAPPSGCGCGAAGDAGSSVALFGVVVLGLLAMRRRARLAA